MTGNKTDYLVNLAPHKRHSLGIARAPFSHMDEEGKAMFESAVSALHDHVSLDPADVPGVGKLDLVWPPLGDQPAGVFVPYIPLSTVILAFPRTGCWV